MPGDPRCTPPGEGGSGTRFSDSGLGFQVWGCFESIDRFWEGLETSRNRKDNEHLERYWRAVFPGSGSVIGDWGLFSGCRRVSLLGSMHVWR